MKIPPPWYIRWLYNGNFHLANEFPFIIFSMTYVGLSMLLLKIRAIYSPKIPNANNWVPEKITIKEARNENPGTLPSVKYIIKT